MKKIILITSTVLILIGLYYFVSNSKETSEVSKTVNQQPSSNEFLNSEDFVWSDKRLQEGPGGGSDFISTSELKLSVNGQTYIINDYLEDSIYGCQQINDEYRDSILQQYDNSYSPDFFSNFVSYFSCNTMGGGDLFVVKETEDMYEVQHYNYGDTPTPFTDTEPQQLFTISK